MHPTSRNRAVVALIGWAIVGSVMVGQDRPAAAELIVTNARVITMAANATPPTAFAISGEKFVAVGTDADVAPFRGAATRVVDAGGRAVIPGLNDSHLHAVRQGRFHNLELRWDGVDSLEKALLMVHEQAKRTPKGHWVRVIGGWSPHQFRERRMPTIRELNEAAPATPVMVLFLYSLGMVNQAGVAAMGLTADTAPPPGGRFELVDGGGAFLRAEPSPVILYQAVAGLPQLTSEEQVNSCRHWYRELNRLGLTSVVDPGGGGHAFPTDYAASAELARQGQLPLRVSLYLFAQKANVELQDYRKWTAELPLHFNLTVARLNGYVVEGAGENLVASAADYENFMAARPNLSAEKLRSDLAAVATVLVRKGWPIRIHATYDETITRVLDVFEDVFAKEQFKGRWIIDHAETISDESIARIKRLGGGVAIQNRMAFAGEVFAERYGKAAAAAAPPLRKLIAAGVPVGAGTDGTRLSSYNPWVALSWMVSGRTVGGTELLPKENRLTREEALRLYTVGSAWFSGEEDVKGRIAPGQLADFAVLSDDYLSVPEDRIKAIESLVTVVGGEIVHAAPPFGSLAPPPLPAVQPAWAPTAHFGVHQNPVPRTESR